MPVSVPTFIKQAWAAVGTKFTIPDNANPTTGRAGWDQGFSPINLTPVAAGGIPPFGQDMNGVLYDITSAIQYIQAGRSFPYNQDFADAVGGYGKGSLVSIETDLSAVYKSKVDNNLTPPPSANWEIAGTVAQATESVAGIAKVSTLAESDAGLSDQVFITPKKTRPYLSGNATLTGSNNNIALVGIVSSLGLERGDVIRVVAGSYNKLHSVESLTNSDNVVVNYEHCGTRGNGSLKLPDYTGVVTITRVSKWYNATNGVGQAWVDLSAFRAKGATYTNSTGRPIEVSLGANRPESSNTAVTCGGVTVAFFSATDTARHNANFTAANLDAYILPAISGAVLFWSEVR